MANIQPPPLTGNDGFDRWLRLFVLKVFSTSTTDTTATADHTALENLNTSSYTHLTASQAQGLTSNSDTVLHFHAADRDRANHAGTQTASTISDFSAAVQAVSTNNNGFYLAFAAAQG